MDATHNDSVVPFSCFKPIIDLEVLAASPIDPLLDDPNASADGVDIALGMSPADIFRDDSGDCEMEVESLQTLRRPINEQQQPPLLAVLDSCKERREASSAQDESSRRVISPYPFSHRSKEESEGLEQLTNAFDWSLETAHYNTGCSVDKRCEKVVPVFIDYSQFFNFGEVEIDQVMNSCDDFSLSSIEANSLSDDFCLSTISEDPASFWEEGMASVVSNRS